MQPDRVGGGRAFWRISENAEFTEKRGGRSFAEQEAENDKKEHRGAETQRNAQRRHPQAGFNRLARL